MIPQYRTLKLKLPKYRMKKKPIPQSAVNPHVPLNKDVSQAITALFPVPFSKNGRVGGFRGFSLLFVEVETV